MSDDLENGALSKDQMASFLLSRSPSQQQQPAPEGGATQRDERGRFAPRAAALTDQPLADAQEEEQEENDGQDQPADDADTGAADEAGDEGGDEGGEEGDNATDAKGE